MLRPDRLPRLPLLPGVADIEMLGGTGVFEGIFEAVVAPAEEVGADEVVKPSFEGVFRVVSARPVVFKFAVAEDPTDEVKVNVVG